jgi:nicotinamide mononucleotide (NMN) deamidase PncC
VISQKLGGTGENAFVQGIVLSTNPGVRRFLSLSEREVETLSGNPRDLARNLAVQTARIAKTDLGLATAAILKETQGKGEFRFETHCCLHTPEGREELESVLGGESAIVRERASIIALDLVRKYILKPKLSDSSNNTNE